MRGSPAQIADALLAKMVTEMFPSIGLDLVHSHKLFLYGLIVGMSPERTAYHANMTLRSVTRKMELIEEKLLP